MKRYLVANWKINPESLSAALRLVRDYGSFSSYIKNQIVVCPPDIFLTELIDRYRHKFSWGAQNVFWEKGGAFTGEISPQLLKSIGVKYALVGHSERREHLEETDVMVFRKFRGAIDAGITPILCVGGGKEARSKRSNPIKIIAKQTQVVLKKLSKNTLASRPWMLTYEPPWALSTVSNNKAAPTALIAKSMVEMRGLLSKILGSKLAGKIPVLYGGSANASNIEEITEASQSDGYLVGGASLRPKEFNQMVKIYLR